MNKQFNIELLEYLNAHMNNQQYRLNCFVEDNKFEEAKKQTEVINFLQRRIHDLIEIMKPEEPVSPYMQNIMKKLQK